MVSRQPDTSRSRDKFCTVRFCVYDAHGNFWYIIKIKCLLTMTTKYHHRCSQHQLSSGNYFQSIRLWAKMLAGTGWTQWLVNNIQRLTNHGPIFCFRLFVFSTQFAAPVTNHFAFRLFVQTNYYGPSKCSKLHIRGSRIWFACSIWNLFVDLSTGTTLKREFAENLRW